MHDMAAEMADMWTITIYDYNDYKFWSTRPGIHLPAVSPSDPRLLARLHTVNGRNLRKKIRILCFFVEFLHFFRQNQDQ